MLTPSFTDVTEGNSDVNEEEEDRLVEADVNEGGEEQVENTEQMEEKCAKEDVDIMDVRIEGMEAAMMEMNNLVQHMQKKVSSIGLYTEDKQCAFKTIHENTCIQSRSNL